MVTASFTKEQYSQLLNLLESQNSSNVDQNAVSVSSGSGTAFLAGKFCLLSSYGSDWIIDSGATDHMCCDLKYFDSYEKIYDSTFGITIPDGTRVNVTHKGIVKLDDGITLLDVLLVPGFKFNLLSVGKLCQDMDCEVVFKKDICVVQGHSQRMPIVLGRLKYGLYCAPTTQHKFSKADGTLHAGLAHVATSSKHDDELKLMHLRMGHIPFNKIPLLNPSLHTKTIVSESFCQICPLAKQHRLPFTPSSIKSDRIFQLLHIDIWGPYRVATHDGCKLFLTIVDDYSRFTWVHLLKFKSDAIPILQHFIAYVETQFQTLVLSVRTDNALELCEGDLKQFYLKKGIIHQTSCVNTPQQNGVVERKHKHLLETARALFFQSRVPTVYWGECVLCATHLINRIPLSPIKFLSPYQKLYGVVPDFTHLKVFGCLCFVSTSSVNRTKFDYRSEPHVFLGYSVTQKAYKVLNIKTKRLHCSRDVVFFERHFPFHYQSSNPTF
ncbi:Retrovirus-related Pol polyprotein from transposon RE2 [Bienertia sinuspersici]